MLPFLRACVCPFVPCSLAELDPKLFAKGKAVAAVRSEQEIRQTQQVGMGCVSQQTSTGPVHNELLLDTCWF